MSKCPNCGGNFPLNSFVCDYCGYVLTERVKQIDSETIKHISFDDSMSVIKDNLDALHEIHHPNIGDAVMQVLRVIAAIHTFGLILIFWKKKTESFDKKTYNRLKIIVERNIKLLKKSSEGSDKLKQKIAVVEDELYAIDADIKRSVRIKQIVIVLMVVGYLSLFIFNDSKSKSHYTIYPAENVITGDLKDYITVENKAYKLKLPNDSLLNELDVKVKFRILEKNEYLTDSFFVGFVVVDSAGVPNPFFSVGTMSQNKIKQFKDRLMHGYGMQYINFNIKTKSRLQSFNNQKYRFQIITVR